jgi:hypothetical protein
MNGSELDVESGEVVTGGLMLLLTRFRKGLGVKRQA